MAQMITRVLVVEDDMALRPFWESIIAKIFPDSETVWTVSGEEAKDILRKARLTLNKISLVISDVFLAGSETGLDLMRFIELSEPNIGFILVSAVDEDRLSLTVDEFLKSKDIVVRNKKALLSKPLNLSDCEKTIRRVMEQSAV